MRAENASPKRHGINLFLTQSSIKDVKSEIECRDDAMFDQTMHDTTTAGQNDTGFAELTLLAGTTILTALGEQKVEDLRPGDRVITRDCGMSRLCGVLHGDAPGPTVRIKADAFGPAYPLRDMVLPADTVIRFRDARTTATRAGAIAAHAHIDHADTPRGTCITLCFDRRHIIYADGMELCAGAA
jgi:hypothetical protein